MAPTMKATEENSKMEEVDLSSPNLTTVVPLLTPAYRPPVIPISTPVYRTTVITIPSSEHGNGKQAPWVLTAALAFVILFCLIALPVIVFYDPQKNDTANDTLSTINGVEGLLE